MYKWFLATHTRTITFFFHNSVINYIGKDASNFFNGFVSDDCPKRTLKPQLKMKKKLMIIWRFNVLSKKYNYTSFKTMLFSKFLKPIKIVPPPPSPPSFHPRDWCLLSKFSNFIFSVGDLRAMRTCSKSQVFILVPDRFYYCPSFLLLFAVFK